MAENSCLTCVLQAALHAAKTDKAAMTKAMKKADAILRDLVQITLRSDLTKIQRTNLETCITVHMHQKEVSRPTTCPACVEAAKGDAVVHMQPISTPPCSNSQTDAC